MRRRSVLIYDDPVLNVGVKVLCPLHQAQGAASRPETESESASWSLSSPDYASRGALGREEAAAVKVGAKTRTVFGLTLGIIDGLARLRLPGVIVMYTDLPNPNRNDQHVMDPLTS